MILCMFNNHNHNRALYSVEFNENSPIVSSIHWGNGLERNFTRKS